MFPKFLTTLRLARQLVFKRLVFGYTSNINCFYLIFPTAPVFPTKQLMSLADPGKASGCSTHTIVIHWLINSPFLPWPYNAAKPKPFEMVLPVKKCCTCLGHSKSQRISKLHHWLNVTAMLLNWMILPMGWVASGRVCDQPAQQVLHYFFPPQYLFASPLRSISLPSPNNSPFPSPASHPFPPQPAITSFSN